MHLRTKLLTSSAHLLAAVSLISVGGWLGYQLRDHRSEAALTSPADALPRLEYFLAPESFSRVANAKRNLEAVCARVRLEIQNRVVRATEVASEEAGLREKSSFPVERMLSEIEQAMHEFEGTEQELVLAQDLLLALKKSGHIDRWLDVYLKVLYQHPTRPLAADFAEEAIAFSKVAGRQEQVLTALRYLNAIPLDFDGKAEVQAALMQASPHPELTQAEIPSDWANRTWNQFPRER